MRENAAARTRDAGLKNYFNCRVCWSKAYEWH